MFVFWRLSASIIVPLSFELLFWENLFKKQYHWCWVTIDYKKSVPLFIYCATKKLFQGTESIFFWESENQIKNQIHQQSIQSASDFDSKIYRGSICDSRKRVSLPIKFLETCLISNWISSKHSEFETFSKYSRWEENNAIKKSWFGPY